MNIKSVYHHFEISIFEILSYKSMILISLVVKKINETPNGRQRSTKH